LPASFTYLDLQRGAEWMRRGAHTPSLRVPGSNYSTFWKMLVILGVKKIVQTNTFFETTTYSKSPGRKFKSANLNMALSSFQL